MGGHRPEPTAPCPRRGFLYGSGRPPRGGAACAVVAGTEGADLDLQRVLQLPALGSVLRRRVQLIENRTRAVMDRPSVLIVSNGRGEDAVGAAVASLLRPVATVEDFPLVGV